MTVRQVILCERNGIWATLLRGQLAPEVRLVQPGDLESVEGLLAAEPASALAISLTRSNHAALLDLLCRVVARYPRACPIILANTGMAAWEWLFREAGAVHFCTSPRAAAGLAQTLHNHFRRQPAAAADVAHSIWDELPWRDATTASLG